MERNSSDSFFAPVKTTSSLGPSFSSPLTFLPIPVPAPSLPLSLTNTLTIHSGGTPLCSSNNDHDLHGPPPILGGTGFANEARIVLSPQQEEETTRFGEAISDEASRCAPSEESWRNVSVSSSSSFESSSVCSSSLRSHPSSVRTAAPDPTPPHCTPVAAEARTTWTDTVEGTEEGKRRHGYFTVELPNVGHTSCTTTGNGIHGVEPIQPQTPDRDVREYGGASHPSLQYSTSWKEAKNNICRLSAPCSSSSSREPTEVIPVPRENVVPSMWAPCQDTKGSAAPREEDPTSLDYTSAFNPFVFPSPSRASSATEGVAISRDPTAPPALPDPHARFLEEVIARWTAYYWYRYPTTTGFQRVSLLLPPSPSSSQTVWSPAMETYPSTAYVSASCLPTPTSTRKEALEVVPSSSFSLLYPWVSSTVSQHTEGTTTDTSPFSPSTLCPPLATREPITVTTTTAVDVGSERYPLEPQKSKKESEEKGTPCRAAPSLFSYALLSPPSYPFAQTINDLPHHPYWISKPPYASSADSAALGPNAFHIQETDEPSRNKDHGKALAPTQASEIHNEDVDLHTTEGEAWSKKGFPHYCHRCPPAWIGTTPHPRPWFPIGGTVIPVPRGEMKATSLARDATNRDAGHPWRAFVSERQTVLASGPIGIVGI